MSFAEGVGRAAAVLVLVAVAWAPAPARADGARARAHFEKGKSYFQISEYRKALEEFKAAHVEKPDAAYLYNIAECHRNLGEPKEAAVFYQRFLKLAPPDSPMRSSAEKQLAELQAPAPAATGATSGGPAAVPPQQPPPSTAPPPVVPPAAAPAPAASSGAPALLTASPAAPAPTLASTPVYERPWFLIAAGALVIGGAAVGVWALTSRGGGTPQTTLGNQGIFDR